MKFKIIAYDEIASTSTEAKRLLQEDEISDPTLVTAKTQKGGRGSRGRTWSSPRGNIYATFAFEYLGNAAQLPLIVYPMSLAIRECISKFASSSLVKIKWPNDILIDGKKVSGALYETVNDNGKIYILAGIGVNVESEPDVSLNYPACHLREYSYLTLTVDEVLQELTQQVGRVLTEWNSEVEIDHVLDTYKTHLFRLGEKIEVSTRGDRSDSETGILKGINSQGQLELKTEAGVKNFSTGTVFPDLKKG